MPTIPHSGGKPPAPEQPTSDAVTISPFYHSSVNEITQPNSYTACSHYLTRRWKRELGPTGYAILTSFRDRCFFNRKTGELRDVIQVPVTDIATECGISEKTVRRELATNKALQRFVRAQREPVPDARRGGWHWGPNTYQVAMDDPIHPVDEPELLEIVRRKATEADKVPEDPLMRARRLATLGQPDRTQNDGGRQRSVNLSERRDNLTGGPDKLTATPGQIDRTLKSLDSSLPEKTFPDAATAAPDFSASLFEDQEPNRTDPLPQRWEDLAEPERRPYLDRARQELLAIHAGSGIAPKPKLIEVRAQNLYTVAKKEGDSNATVS